MDGTFQPDFCLRETTESGCLASLIKDEEGDFWMPLARFGQNRFRVLRIGGFRDRPGEIQPSS
jgi:hypothetical protein